MNNKEQRKLFITEISEEDFRKLDLVAYEMFKRESEDKLSYNCVWKEIKMNDVLDENIKACFASGYESDLEDLQCPFTIAIHKGNASEPEQHDFYLDKFMNRWPRTYQFGCGIKHLFSTRDYFEDHEEHWRVSKRETKSIYRIHLDPKWAKMFKLKHTMKTLPWHEVYLNGNEDWEVDIHYDYDEENDKWYETDRYKIIKGEAGIMVIPVDENGNEIKHK